MVGSHCVLQGGSASGLDEDGWGFDVGPVCCLHVLYCHSLESLSHVSASLVSGVCLRWKAHQTG